MAAVVVLPEPFSPTSITTTGEGPPRSSCAGLLAQQPLQLAMDDLDEVLLGREAAQHLLTERVLLDRLDEVAHDRDVDVGFEERQAHVAQRFLDVPLGDSSLALQLAPQCFELLAQGFEHD